MPKPTVSPLDMQSPANGYFDVWYSPDDDGWCVDLLFNRDANSPISDTEAEAVRWAKNNGGKRRID